MFPSFLSHRVTPITKGTRYSIITWMEGQYIQMKITLCPYSMVIDNTIISHFGSLSTTLEQDGHETEQIDLNLLSAYTILGTKENYFGDSHIPKNQSWMVKNYNKILKKLLKYLKSFGIVGLIR